MAKSNEKKTSTTKKSKAVKKAVKTAKKNKKLAAVIIAIVLLIIIAIVVIYIVKPDLILALIDLIKGKSGDETTSGTIKFGEGTLEVKVLDIGQGDCILITFPDNQVMIMDIGSEFGTTSPWNVINEELKARKLTTVDYLFLSHSDYDHVREGKKLCENYEIKNFYIPRVEKDVSNTWSNFVDAMNEETYGENIKSKIVETVGTFTISGQNWSMKCISYDEADYPTVKNSSSATVKNSVSPICFLTYSQRTIVLTGDANEKNEEYLLKKGYLDGYDADVLKVAHHGSKSSTNEEFLNKVDCEYAIISASADNDYGHPTPELITRLDEYRDIRKDGDYDGYKQVYITKDDGDVTVQVGKNGNMNLISEKDESKNIADTRVTIEGVSVDIQTEYIFVRRYVFV